MQEFLLNDKVITEQHMQAIDLKQRTKYVKKYDMPFKKISTISQKNEIQNLFDNHRKNLFAFKNDQASYQNSKKTKNLLSNLNIQAINFNIKYSESDLTGSPIKTGCFTVRGIKKSIKELNQTKKQSTQRTCSLVATNRSWQSMLGQYNVNADIRFRRSPRCFISPTTCVAKKQMKFHPIDKQNIYLTDGSSTQDVNMARVPQKKPQMTIKQIIDQQIELQSKKRRAICRTAPISHTKRVNSNVQNICSEQRIYQAQAKIYSQMRQNRERSMKRSNDMLGINLQKNKPFSNLEINRNTVKLLKKYKCDNMVYFNKFISKD